METHVRPTPGRPGEAPARRRFRPAHRVTLQGWRDNGTAVQGVVERIVFRNADNGYVVARIQAAARRDRLVSVAGTMPGLAVGEAVQLQGIWADDPRHGPTFQVASYQVQTPGDIDAIRRYIGSGILPGVGPATADRIVATFAERSLEILDQQPERLTEVRGISPRRASQIGAAWTQQRETREVGLFLQRHGVSPGLAAPIQARFGERSLPTLEQHPYVLAHEVRGIGFQTADQIGRALGLADDSLERISAAARHVLSNVSDAGDCYLSPQELVTRTASMVQLPFERVAQAVDLAQKDRRIIVDRDDAYLPALHTAEAGFARRLLLLQRTSRPVAAGESDLAILQTAATATGLLLSDEQREALLGSLKHPVSIITGGPGVGKTTALRALIAILLRRQVPFCLAAPTGRAARRLSEATGQPATTLHRLLDYVPADASFRSGPDRPLPYRFVIVDEASMLDVVLAYHLGQAIAPDAQLLLVGDADQLPSVGPGNVLRDLIASESVPVARLNTLFRQARDSAIIRQATAIRSGAFDGQLGSNEEFFFVEERHPEAATAKIVRLVGERIPFRYGLDPQREIQVLCPVNRGVAGVTVLNDSLQRALNGGQRDRGLRWNGQRFALGDKVMQTRNNYDLNVFNGDVGHVIGVNMDDQILHVDYGVAANGVTAYSRSDLDDVQLAYATSVHKAQGSEYPAVVLLLLPHHGPMLRRDVLYTAVTRAKRLCVIVGSRDAVTRAVATSEPEARKTRLRERLQARDA